jgi:hypothetical protein
MLVVQDEQPVETLWANRAHKPLRYAARLRRANRRANDFEPIRRNTSSQLSVNFWSRSRIRQRNDLDVLPESSSVDGPAVSPTARSEIPRVVRNMHAAAT